HQVHAIIPYLGYMRRHGWDISGLEAAGKLSIVRVDPQDVMHIIKDEYGTIVDSITDTSASRVVIDSLSSIQMMIEGEYQRRQGVLRLLKWLRKSNCTALMIAESEQDPAKYSRHGIAEFLVDGVIVLYNLRRGKTRIRALEVLKMRGTKQTTNLVPYSLDNGIQLQPHQVIFGEIGGE
ncbi:RAD55 family ATPase, partial [Candidatus Altiarchaeota archaeon]